MPDALTWAREQAQIVHPTRGRIAFSPYPYQEESLNTCMEPRRLVLKARQIGYSQIFALEALYKAIAYPESTILLVSRSQDLAVNLLRSCYQTYNGLKDAPPLTKENESEMGLANGSRVKSIPANRSTGRGFAASHIYLDEFAFAAYADDIYQSVSPAVSQGGTLTIGSTPLGNTNLFYTLWATGAGFVRQRVPWYRCPAYNPDGYAINDDQESKAAGEAGAWYARERPKYYTSQQWASEFECDFVGSGDAVFQVADLDRALDGALGEQPPVPRGRVYLTTVDVGRRRNATVINVFDPMEWPYQRVYHERLEGLPYPVIQNTIAAIVTRYPGLLFIESNGIGDPLIENLSVPAERFLTTQRSKVQAIQALQWLLESGGIKAQWTDQERRELTLYAWNDRGLTQDCVMSLAIGAAVLAAETFSTGGTTTIPDDMRVRISSY